MATILDANLPDWLRKKLLGESGRGLPFSPQYGVDEPGRVANIEQFVDEQIGHPNWIVPGEEKQVDQQPAMQRMDVAGHLDQMSRIQANRNRWDARTRAFGGGVKWDALPDISKQSKLQDEMISDEITSRMNNAILSGEIKDIEGAMRWFKAQGFDKHFEGDARKAATAVLDQLMQEEGREESKQKHVWAGETAQRQATEYTQSQLDRASTQAADLQSEKVQNKIGEMINDNSQTWAEDAGDYELGQYRESEIRYDAQQLEGFSESEKQTIFAKVMEGLQAETAQVGRFEVADQEMQVAQERDRLQALADAGVEEQRAGVATDRQNQISNAGVDMLNRLMGEGVDQQTAINQVMQQMSDWANDPNFQGLVQEGGKWVPQTNIPRAGTVEGGGLQAPGGAGAVPLDAAAINQAFLQQVGTRGEQAAATKEPAAFEWINTAVQKLADTGDLAKNTMNIQSLHAAEMNRSGQESPFWYNHSHEKQRGITWQKIMGYANMAQPGRIDRNAIVREYETSEAVKYASELRDKSKKAKGDARIAIVEEMENVIDGEVRRIAEKWNWPYDGTRFIIFPDLYEIGISTK